MVMDLRDLLVSGRDAFAAQLQAQANSAGLLHRRRGPFLRRRGQRAAGELALTGRV
jgi:hypothetical protein